MKLKSEIPNKVIVIGGDHHNALGIIRSLAEIGCKPYFIVTGTSKSYVAKSKYVEKFWNSESDQNIINILFKEFNKEELKPIIIPSDDYTTSFIDKNLSKLISCFIIPNINNKENSITKKMNKQVMNELAEKYGLMVPKSYEVNLDELSTRDSIEGLDLIYPCIIKPLYSIDGTKSDIMITKNSSDLQKNLKKLHSNYKDVIIQEYINKEGELGVQGIVTNKKREVIIPGIIEKLRQSTVAPGSTTYAKLTKSNQLVELDKIQSFIGDLGYSGIFDMELMFSKGKVYFIELNFRNGAYGYAITKAGTNLPALWCLDAAGYNISKESKFIKKELTFMSELSDFRNVFEKNIRPLTWLREFLKTDVYLILNKHDLWPFLYKIMY